MPRVDGLSHADIYQLGALDFEFFGKVFFPQSFRSRSPDFHRDMWRVLEDRAHRYVAIMVFRGGGKTTTLRAFTAKRIAYGTSRTVMYVGASQGHAVESVRWLRKRIMHNRHFSGFFGLEPGNPWTDEICEVRHVALGHSVTVMAVGITGQIRGFNIDDYRPDLIVVDDPSTEENTASEVQRKKAEDLFFGGLAKSLASPVDAPDAKQVLLQTPLNVNDLVSKCHRSSWWASRRYGCFDERGRSRWEEVYPTDFLRREKENHIRENRLSLWLREMECTVIAGENTDFRPEWLKEYSVEPDGMMVFMGIDPVPPATDLEVDKGIHDRDYEALVVVGRHRGNLYLLEYSRNRGHMPEWTISEFFRLVDKWRPLKVKVEGVAYQRTLGWILQQEMHRRRRYVQVDVDTDRRRGRHRILQALTGPCSNGRFFVKPDMVEFREEYGQYPFGSHDDLLLATALAVEAANTSYLDDYPVEDDALLPVGDGEPVADWRGAP